MKCPACDYTNIPGEDSCVNCQADLSSLDGVTPKTKIERILMQDSISKLKPKEALCVSKETTIDEAIRKMNEHNLGSVFVEGTGGQVIGIVTERDILMRAIGKIKNLAKGKVSEIMTPNPTTLDEDDSLAYALHQMSVNRCRRIAILREGKKPGIITTRDVLNYLAKLFP